MTVEYVNRDEGIRRLREAEESMHMASHCFYEHGDGELLTGSLCYVLGGWSQAIASLADFLEEEGAYESVPFVRSDDRVVHDDAGQADSTGRRGHGRLGGPPRVS